MKTANINNTNNLKNKIYINIYEEGFGVLTMATTKTTWGGCVCNDILK
jgi:hypothetical protein